MGRVDPIARREYNRAYKERNREANRARQRTYMAQVYAERREFLRSYKAERACARCGFNDPRALEFHHRDPRQKRFVISQACSGRRWEDVLAEIKKCDLICANCHQIEHSDSERLGRPRTSAVPEVELQPLF